MGSAVRAGIGWGWGTQQVPVSHLGICPERRAARAPGACRGTAAFCVPGASQSVLSAEVLPYVCALGWAGLCCGGAHREAWGTLKKQLK